MSEIELVKLVLSAHQTSYARFHCGEGRKVIESNEMAIGYASVELAKALRPNPLIVNAIRLAYYTGDFKGAIDVIAEAVGENVLASGKEAK